MFRCQVLPVALDLRPTGKRADPVRFHVRGKGIPMNCGIGSTPLHYNAISINFEGIVHASPDRYYPGIVWSVRLNRQEWNNTHSPCTTDIIGPLQNLQKQEVAPSIDIGM